MNFNSDKILRAIWVTGGFVGFAAILVMPKHFYVGAIIIWIMQCFGWYHRERFAPEIRSQSPDTKAAMQFIGWFVLAVIGIAFGAVSVTNGWQR